MGVTNTFTPNTRIRSAEVNTNFTECENGTAMDNVTNAIAMANNTNINFKNAAGANDANISEDTSDNLVIESDNNIELSLLNTGDVVLFRNFPRRAQASNTYQNAHIQSGWGYIQGDGTATLAATVTFPIAYNSGTVRVVIAPNGHLNAVPANENNLTLSTFPYNTMSSAVTGTQFTATLFDPISPGSTFANTQYYGYAWISTGPINV